MSDAPKPAPELSDAEKGLQALKQSAQWVILGVAVVMLGVTLYQRGRAGREAAAQEQFMALSTAFTLEALEDVQTAFAGKPAGALANFQRAAMLLRDGELNEALAQYDLFLQSHPRHPLTEGARFGRLVTLEELGHLEDALAGFRGFAESNIFYPQALFAQARILEKTGQTDDAIEIYSDIEARFADEMWAFQAEEFRKAARTVTRPANEDLSGEE